MTAIPIPSGDAGTLATVRIMRELALQGAVSVPVRTLAARLVLETGRDAMLQARLINDWIDTHTQFLPDPSTVEALVPADMMLARIARDGIGQGDCDDVAVLAASMGLSVGLLARFVVVGFGASDAPYAHVWAELGSADGSSWLAIDPTRPVDGLPPVGRASMLDV